MRFFLQAHLLAALLLLGGCGDSIAGNLIPADRERFALITRAIYRQASHDSLRQQAGEFLERFAMRYVREAQQQILKADITGAEASLLQALDLKPDSMSLLLRLGRLMLPQRPAAACAVAHCPYACKSIPYCFTHLLTCIPNLPYSLTARPFTHWLFLCPPYLSLAIHPPAVRMGDDDRADAGSIRYR